MLISYEKATKEIERLIREKEMIKEILKKSPEGELSCAKNGLSYKWYVNRNGINEYLPKNNEKTARQLAYKKYLKIKLRDIEYELEGLRKYQASIKKIIEAKQNTEKLLLHKEYSKLLDNRFQPVNKTLAQWQKEEYEKCIKNSEKLIVKGTNGKMLRSKSEAMIDMMLYTNKIPFRYEDKMILEGITIYPDFTIRHPKTGEVIIWEHFGMMDDSGYAEKTFNKMTIYARNGFIPGINLIATYETASKPLNMEEVRNNIEKYFGTIII